MDEHDLINGNTAPAPDKAFCDAGKGEIYPNHDGQQTERRAFRRKRVLKPAAIKFDQNYADAPCIIHNLSEAGALAEITAEYAIPQNFTMRIPMNGYEVDCHTSWQNGHRIKISFVGEKRKLPTKKIQYIKASSANIHEISGNNDITDTNIGWLDKYKSEPKPSRKSAQTPSFGKRT